VNNTDVEAPNPGCKPKLEINCKSDWLIGMFKVDPSKTHKDLRSP